MNNAPSVALLRSRTVRWGRYRLRLSPRNIAIFVPRLHTSLHAPSLFPPRLYFVRPLYDTIIVLTYTSPPNCRLLIFPGKVPKQTQVIDLAAGKKSARKKWGKKVRKGLTKAYNAVGTIMAKNRRDVKRAQIDGDDLGVARARIEIKEDKTIRKAITKIYRAKVRKGRKRRNSPPAPSPR